MGLKPSALRAWLAARSSATCSCWRAFSSDAASSNDGKVRGSPQATAIRPYGSGFRASSHLWRSKTEGRQSAPTGMRGTPAADANATAPTLATSGGPPPSGEISDAVPPRTSLAISMRAFQPPCPASPRTIWKPSQRQNNATQSPLGSHETISFTGILGLRAVYTASSEGALPCQIASTEPRGTSGHRKLPTVTISDVAATARAYPYKRRANNLVAIQWIGGKNRRMSSSVMSTVRVMRFLPTL